MLNFLKKYTDKDFKEIDSFIKLIIARQNYIWSPNDLKDIEEYQNLLNQKPEVVKPIILHLVKYVEAVNNKRSLISNDNQRRRVALIVLAGLTRRNQSYDEKEWIELFSQIISTVKNLQNPNNKFEGVGFSDFPLNFIIQQIERYLKKNKLSDQLKEFIVQILSSDINAENSRYWGSDTDKSVAKLKALIQDEDILVKFVLKTEDIGKEINAVIEQSPIRNEKNLHDLLTMAETVNGGKPTKKFLKDVSGKIEALGRDNYRKVVQEMLQVVADRPVDIIEKRHVYADGSVYTYPEQNYLCAKSAQFAKGLIWTMEVFSDKQSIQLLETILHKSYTKVPGVGPVAMAVGNACAYTLGNMRGKDGLGALSRAKLKLKQNNIKKTIDKYLLEGAKKYHVSVEELKEMAVPDFKLSQGQKNIAFKDYQLKISIEHGKVTQQWINPEGKPMKSVPSAVKNDTKLSAQLKEVRKEVKEIQKVYSAQKQRIDNQFILNRTWDFESFDKFYLSHGLVSNIVKDLIWIIEKGEKKTSALFRNGQWENNQGEVINWVDKDCNFRLWHPVFSNEKEIVAWRDRMMKIECKQPIKQAFRELYILTDAELNTRNYSNRMASHILKQHQFKTLAIMRDWSYSLMGSYDDGVEFQTCSKDLPDYGMTAEYWIDELADDESFNDVGIWLYVATDQVKFKNQDDQPIDLVDVPPIVFSEIMRDVDLFVGVCSVGNDPEWQDNNGERQNNYWRAYSFGNLSEIAKTRKSILERLLPRLKKINKVASIDGNFLVIKGNIRTYKIHIGSGNILMEPNDQYLCIVPARNIEKTTDKLFIPFEGDKGLSIVLSKAFLLAEDTKITDETILSQLGRV